MQSNTTYTAFAAVLATGVFAASPSPADVFTFETPSENIQCDVGLSAGRSDITCTIISVTNRTTPPKPASCRADWGHTFFMFDRGPARIECVRTNRSKDAQQRAEYGVTGTFGGFVCASATSGLSCTNRDGHGFFLSRRAQRIF